MKVKLNKILMSAYLANLVWLIFMIWSHLNVLQVDIAGHIASAASFERGLFHRFNSQFFLGYIQGLFYPPLEDVILATFHQVLAGNWLLAYKVYLSLIAALFLFSMWRFSQVIEDRLASVALSFGLLVIFWADRSTINFQGMGQYDLLVTGLSNQILAGIAFFFFLRAWMLKQPWWKLAIYAVIILLSHIVVALVTGLVVTCLVAGEIWQSKGKLNKKIYQDLFLLIIWSLGLTAFYWLPFVAHREMVVSSTIYAFHTGWLLLYFCLGFLGTKGRAKPWYMAAILLYLPLILGPLLKNYQIRFPPFHYYRFAVFSLIFALVGWSAAGGQTVLGTKWARQGRYLWLTFGVAGLFLLFHELNFKAYDLASIGFTPVSLPTVTSLKLEDSQVQSGRYWFIGNQRPSDFGLEALLSLEHPEISSNKGLFWESHRSHTILNSYLATLLGLPVVLDYEAFNNPTCELQKCLIDSFAVDFNLRGIVLDEVNQKTHFNNFKLSCYQEILTQGTPLFEVSKSGSLNVSKTDYGFYDFLSRSVNSHLTSASVEFVRAREFRSYQYDGRAYFEDYIHEVVDSCRQGHNSNVLFIEKQGLERARLTLNSLTTFESSQQTGNLVSDLKMKEIAPGQFEFEIPGDEDRLFRIKLSYFPGVHLVGADGHDQLLLEALPGMVGRGHGRLHLEYRKTTAMRVGEVISLLFTVILVLGILIRPIRIKLFSRSRVRTFFRQRL